MLIELAAVSLRKQRMKLLPAEQLVHLYLERMRQYIAAETRTFETEALLLDHAKRSSLRPAAQVILLDSRGKALDSLALASHVGRLRDSGMQRLIVGVGPADGWSAAARSQAGLLLSFGAITLPHELALVVAAEQFYRAQTILAGHPYHSGHS